MKAEETHFQITYAGRATSPTREMQHAAPWILGGYGLIALAILLYFGFGVLALRRRTGGRWLTLSGLIIVVLYFIFQNTVARDAELRYGPVADALSLVAYGTGGLLVTAGYARLVLQQRGHSGVR
jgi:hypothetical protein